MTEKLAPNLQRLLELLETVTDETYVLGPQDRDDLTFILGLMIDEAKELERITQLGVASSGSTARP